MKKKKTRNKKKNSNSSWILIITLSAFVISFIFSFASEMLLSNATTVVGIIVLVAFILIGILFDMIGVAVTSADISPLNSMSAQKLKGADTAVNFKKNAAKVSSFCNDVVGDICGIISGSAGVIVANSIADSLNFPLLYVTLFITALIASFTIGGKALGKGVAMKNNTKILYNFARVISLVYKPKSK